jgi:hypothetical protein
MKTLRERDIEWLRELDGELWEDKWMTDRYRGGRYVKTELPRRLTDEEWRRVKSIVERQRLPVTMSNTRFGFGVGLVIFEPEREWIYPGVEEESRPPALTMISQSHLPKSESSFDGADKRCLFEDGWRCFEPLTHAQDNFEVLRRCRLKEPGTKGDYAY